LIWEINPETKIAFIHRLDGSVQKIVTGDTLSGESVIPGFGIRLDEIFP
jgi:hypothetical protein